MSKALISNAIFILCVLFIFIFSLISFVKFNSSDYVYIASIGKNWSTGPVSDATAAGYDCPAGKTSLISDYWPGTVSGCSCPALIGEGLSRSTCSLSKRSHLSTFTCTNVAARAQMPYKFWKSVNICVKRGPNYLELKTSSSLNGCGVGYKACGIIDSMKNYLCYPSNVDCPYNEIKVISNNDNVPNDKNYTQVTLGVSGSDGKMLFSNQDKNGNALNEFKIDDKTPCLSPDYKNLNIKPYYLETTWDHNTCKNKIGNEFEDKSYQKVDSTTYGRLYSDNQIIGILSSMPNFQNYNYLNAETYLYYKNYVGLDMRCKTELIGNGSATEFINSLLQLESTIGGVTTCALVGLIFGIIGLVVTIIFVIIFFCSGFDSEKIIFYNIISMIFISIPALIISSILLSKVNNTNYNLSILKEPNCTDPNTSLAISGFLDSVTTGKTMTYVYFSFSLIAIITNIVGFFTYSS